jgi:indolepyruvate ferredoxin oxidoreductase alpha subunit
MSVLTSGRAGESYLIMGNEAIARGALEAGVAVAAGYPGTPSSEIIESLAAVAPERDLYVEWSVNEKVAAEVAAAASLAGLRSLCAMKQNGVNVASDFLLHLALSGTRGGMVIIPCDDPGALSSANEGESRHFARMLEIPLIEPGDFQEAKDMVRWAFELSEKIHSLVMVRSVTRLSHASGNVVFGELPALPKRALFKFDGPLLDPLEGPVISLPVALRHRALQEKLKTAAAEFEASPFNTYSGPESPELLLVTSSACHLYSREAIHMLGAQGRVGLLKLGTTWPLPPRLLATHLRRSEKVMIVEEVIPFLEENIKILAAESAAQIGVKKFFGKREGVIPACGELNPDLVAAALSTILGLDRPAQPAGYAGRAAELAARGAPGRDMTFCAGCPHRAAFWSLHAALAMDGRNGFVCGDIGCYSMAVGPTGFETLKTLHAMGSGVGIASGFGKLRRFGLDQPVMTVVGDSTFFHAAIPALINAIHHQSDLTLVVLDNSGTAMTGFQSHPGRPEDATGQKAPALDIGRICAALGATVKHGDPFDLDRTRRTLGEMLDTPGLKVLLLSQACALSPEKKGTKPRQIQVDADRCLGLRCGCNQLCTRIFKCPGLAWDPVRETARIDAVICTGCGVCQSICPAGAIVSQEVA